MAADWISQIAQVAPGIGAGLSGNGPGMQAFMEAFQRTSQVLEESQRRDQELAMRDRDRQALLTRQAEQDRIAAQDRTRRIEQEKVGLLPSLAELGGTAETPDDAKRLIETVIPGLMNAYGQDVMGYGMPAVEMAERQITARQQRQVKEFVESALKTSFLADNPESDPVVELPSHLQKIVGRPQATLSELQRFGQMPIGKPAQPKTTANPTEASIAMAAAGGDPVKAFSMLNPPPAPPKPDGPPNLRFLKDRDGNIFEWPTNQPAPRGSRPYNETTQRQDDQRVARDASVAGSAEEALALVQKLKTERGMSGAVGAKGPSSLFGVLDRPMGGTNAAGYRAFYDSLKSKLTIPAMQQMRGLGAMSDREFRTMSDSVTALSTDMPEPMFRAELNKIEATLKTVVDRLRVQSAAPEMNSVGGGIKVGQFTVKVKD